MALADALAAGWETLTGLLEWGCGAARRAGLPIGVLGVARRHETETRAPRPPVESPTVGGPQEQVEEAKYFVGREVARPTPAPPIAPLPAMPLAPPALIVDRETGELPRAYGRDRVLLLPRDPWWLFAYWEITPTTRVEALRALGPEAEGAREVLRVYDVTFITFTGDNAWVSFDLDVRPGAESWYLNVWKPSASYCVEVGLRTPQGRFVPIARSNTVTTSPAHPSADTTVRWVTLAHQDGMRDAGDGWSGPRIEHEADDGHAHGLPRSSDYFAPRPH